MEFGAELSSLSEEAFAALQQTMVHMKSLPDESLNEECCRNWEEVLSGEQLFDRNQRQVSKARDMCAGPETGEQDQRQVSKARDMCAYPETSEQGQNTGE